MRLKLLSLCSVTAKRFKISPKRYYATKSILPLHERGMFHDMFPDDAANEIDNLMKTPQCVYAGFDPTAESLHVGNLLVLINLLHWQRAGHQVIALIGGATGRIGDPSGKSQDRNAMERSEVAKNVYMIEDNIKTIFNNHQKHFWDANKQKKELLPVRIVNNDAWYRDISSVDFIGEIGRFFRMGTMLGRESVATRIKSKQGMSFTEFSYMVFQAYDWLHLLKNHSCRFQIGGSDQMGNIMAGHELISRVDDRSVYGLTLPLITSDQGNKLGKTAKNAVWLNPGKTSPFEFYQYFIRTFDTDVEKLLKLLTFETLGTVKDILIKHSSRPERRHAQKKLAENLTLLVHGEEGLRQAEKTTETLYNMKVETLSSLTAQDTFALLPGAPVTSLNLVPGLTVVEASLQAGCFGNEGDARRVMQAGGFRVNDQKTQNPDEVITASAHILPNQLSIMKVGKKNYYIVQWDKKNE